MVTAWKLPAVHLPEGDERDLWIVAGRLSSKAVVRATPLPGRFATPGLVDAHAHVALAGSEPGGIAAIAPNLRTARDGGVLLLRDVGAPASATLDFRADPSLPELIAAGRWHAPAGRFFPELHEPVAAAQLVGSARAEIERGARWIKVVADWRTAELSYDSGTLRDLVVSVHAAGARVAAHVQWTGVREVVAAGVDSVEHGCLLDPETLATMAEQGVAWIPTLTAFNEPLPQDAGAEREDRRRDVLDNFRAMMKVARQRVTILAGTDTAGTVIDEVAHLIEYGLSPTEALRAATTSARKFFGVPALVEGAPANVVTFNEDPRDEPSALLRPAAIVLRGTRIA